MSSVYYIVAMTVLILSYYAESQGYYIGTRVLLEDGSVRRRPSKGATILLAAIMIFVAGFRYFVGTDYGSYYRNYDGSFSKFITSLYQYDEPGINLVAFIGHIFYDDGVSLIFTASLVTIALYISQIYKYSPMFLIGVLLYIFTGEWHGCFNGVRQYLAAAVLFAGHRFILYRKIWKYIITVFIASLFHTSALVMIIPYFFLTRKLNAKQFMLMVIGAIMIRFSYNFLIDGIGIYKGHEVTLYSYITNDVNILRIAVNFVPVAVYGLFCCKQNHTSEEEFYINGMFLNAFIMLATMGSTYIARVGIYTNIYPIIGYAHLFNLIKEKNLKILIIFSAILLFAGYWWYSISSSSELSEFKWIFDSL